MDAEISVIIPMHNAERYLDACLASVEAQTFKRFECLCVDDGSTDRTAEIVRRYAARDPRFQLFRQPNAGCSVARNRGLRAASAPYLFFLDADDQIHPQTFEITARLIEENQADAVSFQYNRVPDLFELVSGEPPATEAFATVIDTYPFRTFFSGHAKRESSSACVRLYRKSAVAGIEFPVGIPFSEDAVFVAKVMRRIRKLVAIPQRLLFYRNNPDSTTNGRFSERRVRSFAEVVRLLHAYFRTQNLSGEEARWMSVFLSTMAYKAFVAPLFRDPALLRQADLVDRAREQWADLIETRTIVARALSIRKRLVATCLAHGWPGAGRVLNLLSARNRKRCRHGH